MKKVIQRYLLKFDEINKYYAELTEGNLAYKKPVEDAVRDFEDILLDAYIEGFAAARYLLGEDVSPDNDRAIGSIDKSYDGISIEEKYAEYYNAQDSESIKNLIESEFHRCYNEGEFDCASVSGGVRKKWTAVRDFRTRISHDILDGTVVDLNERFYSISGDSALYPGGFETAQENANCRCIVEYRR